MIARSRTVKCLAVLLAGSAHGALALALMPDPAPVEIEGSSGGAEVRLGTSFADMAAGTLTAETAGEVTETAPPAATEPLRALERAEAPAPPPAQPAMTAPPAAAPAPVQAARAVPESGAPVSPPEALRPAEIAAAPVAAAPAPSDAARPEEAARAQPAETLTAAEPETAAVQRSLRPQPRSERIETVARNRAEPPPRPAAKAAPRPKPEARPAAKSARGNGSVNARAGSSTGRAEAQATTKGSGGKARSAGNAAASNYPGLVMRRIERVPKPRVGSRGAAVVSFSIAGNGGLAGVSLARSSGSSALDTAALQLVQRAAPFAPPPQGAQRRFSIQIKGR
ncbi:energy transducer TonB family protein [Salipiger sp.]|uniref:energy transducer TonB family protein n=1 Tax=Salipiger sp. TaxID=2078585 RepID=UPI003A9803D2